MSTYLLGILGSASILFFTTEIMRRGLIRERFALIWTLTASAIFVFSIWNQALSWVSTQLGFETPSNFLFFFCSLLLLTISVQYSFELGNLEEQNRTLAIEVALLKNEIRRPND
jgi:hypothetical protein